MLLVADSGSTKADWLLYDGQKVMGPFHTMGFNPLFHSSEKVFEELGSHSDFTNIRSEVKEVKFFGAGCSSMEMNEIIAAGLRQFFTGANVMVEHDLLACAISTCGDQPGIACIIGTGSNSCWFDGQRVQERNYGLGYVLGDEGSGSYMGKRLLTLYLYDRLPSDLHSDFLDSYGLGKDDIIHHVYRQAHANVWLASFTRFLSKHYEHPWIKSFIAKAFDDFAEYCICDYPQYRDVKVHFVGSLASLYKEELIQVATQRNFSIGKIIKQPIEELMEWYISNYRP